MRAKLFLTLALLVSADTALADSFTVDGALDLTIGTTGVSGTAGMLYSDGAHLQSFAATFGTDPNQPTSPGPLVAFGNDISLMLTKDGTYNTAPLSIYDLNTSGAGANLLELYANNGGAKLLQTYFGAGNGALYTRAYIVVSGITSGTNPHQTVENPNNSIYSMIACWEDVHGPCILARENSGNPGDQVFQGMTWDGRSTVAINAGYAEILFGNQTVTNGQYFLGDTFLGRGNAAALLQIGGPDNVTPVAQTFAASGAPAPVTIAAVQGAAGQATVQLYELGVGGSAVMQQIQVGMTVTDTTTSGVIPANTTVTAINLASQLVTLSNNITGSGVQFNDVLVFSTPNTAGSALTIAGGRGTGTGAGGSLCFAYAPAGSSGSSQNAWACEATINGSGLTLNSGRLLVPPGSLSAPSLLIGTGAVQTGILDPNDYELVFTVNTLFAGYVAPPLGGIGVPDSLGFGWAQNDTAVMDTMLTRPATATIHMGAADAAAPVAQSFGVQSVVAGTSNTAGALWSHYDSAGTGSGASGGFSWFTHPAGSSGTAQNAAVLEMNLSSSGVLNVVGGYSINGNAGVSCSGVPTSSAVWTNGLRTTC